MDCSVLAVSLYCGLLLWSAANAVKLSPKLNFDDSSPGISPDNIGTFKGKDETSVHPEIVKAILEVTVGETEITDKHSSKSDKKGDTHPTATKILICTLEGDCKMHEIGVGGTGRDGEGDGSKQKQKPVIVTDFNEDPLKGNGKGENTDKKIGKNNYDVPVIVGYKGAVKDDGFYYTGYGSGSSIDRLPTYYGMKLSPAFYQTYPGASIYEKSPLVSSRPDYRHGSYQPINELNFDLRCVYPYYEHGPCLYPQYESEDPAYVSTRQYAHPYFTGNGPRTPSPYGNLHHTRKPDIYHAIITPIESMDRATDYRPIIKPTEPGVVALHGKMDFDEDKVSGAGQWRPISGYDTVKIDGKLGEALSKSDS